MRPRRCLVSSCRHSLPLCCLASRRVCIACAGPDSQRLQGPAGALLALLLVSAAALATPAPTDAKAAADPGALPGATTAKAVPGAVNTKAAPGAKAADTKAAATEAKTGAALDRAVEANVEAQDYQEETVPVKAQARTPRCGGLCTKGLRHYKGPPYTLQSGTLARPPTSARRRSRRRPEGVLGCSPVRSVQEEALVAVVEWAAGAAAAGPVVYGMQALRVPGGEAVARGQRHIRGARGLARRWCRASRPRCWPAARATSLPRVRNPIRGLSPVACCPVRAPSPSTSPSFSPPLPARVQPTAVMQILPLPESAAAAARCGPGCGGCQEEPLERHPQCLDHMQECHFKGGRDLAAAQQGGQARPRTGAGGRRLRRAGARPGVGDLPSRLRRRGGRWPGVSYPPSRLRRRGGRRPGECQEELDQWCGAVKPGEGRLARCMTDQLAEEAKEGYKGARTGAPCQKALSAFRVARAGNINADLPLARACKADAEKLCANRPAARARPRPRCSARGASCERVGLGHEHAL
jgi:hypothetical protein